MSEQPRGDIYVVSAPSGAGKTTLIRRLLAEIRGLHFSVSHTTRRPRADEAEGVDYHFVGCPEFERMVKQGAFLETAEVHGNRYGTASEEVDSALARGEDALLDLDTQGAASIRRLRPEAILMFILPPGVQALRDRLTRRGGDDPGQLRSRLEAAGREVAFLPMYDYCVVNDSLDRALRDLQAIIRARRLLRERMPADIREIVRGFDAAGVTPRT
jgi:guanylate kinase